MFSMFKNNYIECDTQNHDRNKVQKKLRFNAFATSFPQPTNVVYYLWDVREIVGLQVTNIFNKNEVLQDALRMYALGSSFLFKNYKST